MSWGKYRKVQNFFHSNRKRSIKIDRDDNESVVTISHKTKFIDSARFIATLLSSLIDNLIEAIHKIKFNDCDCFLEYESVKESSIKYTSCNKNYSNITDEELKKRFKNTFKFSNNDINKFILLLRKGIYHYEHVDDWQKFNKISLPEKEEFYSNLKMEDITDADCMQAKRACKDLEINELREYHDLYLKRYITFG